MKKFALIIFISLLFQSARAQYVNIPDTAFQGYLSRTYPSCFNAARQMDTTCSTIVNAKSLYKDFSSATNLDGIQYFKSLDTLDWEYGSVKVIPSLPQKLRYLTLRNNKDLKTLPPLPDSLIRLEVSQNSLTSLPSLPAKLKELYCSFDSLTFLPALSGSLTKADCSYNQITSLPSLPSSLLDLDCKGNQLTSLPSLNASLNKIDCSENQIVSLPSLNSNLQELNCNTNALTSLPSLPMSLLDLACYGNPLNSMPSLPAQLKSLSCGGDNYTSLPSLPASLQSLSCGNSFVTSLPQLPLGLKYLGLNNGSVITALPALPAGLETLVCAYTSLTALPALPPALTELRYGGSSLFNTMPTLPAGLLILECYPTGLTSLPELPASLQTLRVDGYSCLPKLPVTLTTLGIYPAEIPCIPNSIIGLPNYPVCNATNNINGCLSFPNMTGHVFYDLNNNGIKDAGEYNKRSGRVNLSNGAFTFTNDTGFYQLAADTIGAFTVTAGPPPFFKAVPASTTYNFSSYDTTVSQTVALQPTIIRDSLSINVTLSSTPRPGFDMGYRINYRNEGSTDLLTTNIALHFDNSLLTYKGSSNPAVAVSGNTLSLSLSSLPIAEYGEFDAVFTLKTTAPLNGIVTTDVAITSGTASNVDTSRAVITGSFDPNDKTATPFLTREQVTSGKYIDYIIRFQNTGTDTAFHVVITDTLSSMLQWATFEMTASSHSTKATVKEDKATFEMRNIMLPDSNVNERASHGFVRFRVKPKVSAVAGTSILNKASIYFDYNDPVITNTAITQIRTAGAMPLSLIWFKGERSNGKDQLNWSTSNEVNTKVFEVEWSGDGRKFSKVAVVNAIGRGGGDYHHTLDDAREGNAYYRLKMIDRDGAFSYSKVILIVGTNKVSFALALNPVKNSILINVFSSLLVNTDARVINSAGAIVQTFMIKATGAQRIAVNLPEAVYYLQTLHGIEKFVVSK